MDEPTVSKSELWWQRLKKLRPVLRSGFLFILGMAAALTGLLIYNLMTPSPHQLTTSDVSTAVNQVLASATPPAPFSETVYEIIQPSLVLIQSKVPGTDGKSDDSLGTGTIVNTNGDILTSLHVVANATDIQVTFADGTTSSASVSTQQPQNDIAVLKADKLPAEIVPAVLGNPNAMHVGDEAYVVGNPFGLYSSMSAGVISGFNRTFQPQNSKLRSEGIDSNRRGRQSWKFGRPFVKPLWRSDRYCRRSGKSDRSKFLRRNWFCHPDQCCRDSRRVTAGLKTGQLGSGPLVDGLCLIGLPKIRRPDIKEMTYG